MADLSVIVPAYNEEDSLRVFLPELLEFCDLHGLKLIIVNDGSSDGTYQLMKKFVQTERFRVYTHKVNRGYGGAIKTGIRNADTKYVGICEESANGSEYMSGSFGITACACSGVT